MQPVDMFVSKTAFSMQPEHKMIVMCFRVVNLTTKMKIKVEENMLEKLELQGE